MSKAAPLRIPPSDRRIGESHRRARLAGGAYRVQTHIFLCVLAYHLLISIETSFLRKQIHTSWATLRDQLSTHQVVTVVLPTSEGQLLKVRKGTTPEKQHQLIYDTLDIPHEVMAPVKIWFPNS